jgi:hypothetical protein
MHGNPGMATTACHGDVTLSAPAEHHAAPMTTLTKTRSTIGPAAQGQMCQSTPARGRLWTAPTLAAALLFLTLSALAASARAPVRAGVRRRGPPGGGRLLLLDVCVARI